MIRNHLPPRFKNWLEFALSLDPTLLLIDDFKMSGFKSENEIIPPDITVYHFDKQYVLAEAMKEILKIIPDRKELDDLYRMSMNSAVWERNEESKGIHFVLELIKVLN